MQDRRTNELVSGEIPEALKALVGKTGDEQAELEEGLRKEFDALGKVRRADQGPVFIEGEVVPVKGYRYKVKAIVPVKRETRIILVPYGPIPEGEEEGGTE